MKKVLCLSAALICLTAVLTGCGKKEEDTKDYDTAAQVTTAASTKEDAADFTGKWQCEELVMDGEKYDNLWGADAYSIYQIEINEDNTGSFFSFLYAGFLGSDEPLGLKWEKKDADTIICTVIDPNEGTTNDDSYSFDEDEVMTLIKDGDKLVLDMSDGTSEFKAYLAKVDSFTPVPEDMEMSFSTSGDFETNFSTDDLAD